MSEIQTVDAAPKGAALDQAVKDEVTRVLGMTEADRAEYLGRTALTADRPELSAGVTLVESLASVRVRLTLADRATGTATYQAALTFHAARNADWYGFEGQGDYVTRGLGYRAASMGTLLKDLADAAIIAGIEDGSREWRGLVQSSPMRSSLKAALKDGAKTKAGTPTKAAITSAVKAVTKAVDANPTGKAAKAAKGPDSKPSADEAKAKCNRALDVIRAQVPNLSREGKAGMLTAVEALAHWIRTGEEPAVSGEADRNNRSARTGSAQ